MAVSFMALPIASIRTAIIVLVVLHRYALLVSMLLEYLDCINLWRSSAGNLALLPGPTRTAV